MTVPWPFPPEGFQPRHGGHEQPERLQPYDDILRHAVLRQLRTDSVTRGDQIAVEVQNRVVILTGAVRTTATQRAAGLHAWATPGVIDVCNQLRPRGE